MYLLWHLIDDRLARSASIGLHLLGICSVLPWFNVGPTWWRAAMTACAACIWSSFVQHWINGGLCDQYPALILGAGREPLPTAGRNSRAMRSLVVAAVRCWMPALLAATLVALAATSPLALVPDLSFGAFSALAAVLALVAPILATAIVPIGTIPTRPSNVSLAPARAAVDAPRQLSMIRLWDRVLARAECALYLRVACGALLLIHATALPRNLS